jgi:integrase
MSEPRAYKSGKRRGYVADWTDSTGKRHRKRFSGAMAYDQARRWIDRATSVEGAGDGSMAISRLAAEYLGEIESTGKVKPSTVRHYQPKLKSFSDFCVTSGIRQVRQITRPKIEHWQRWWLNGNPGRSKATWNRHIRALSAFLRWCCAKGFVDYPITIGLSQLMAKEVQRPVRYFDREELRLILDYWDKRRPELGLFYRLMSLTGARVNELREVRWEDINLTHGTITFCRNTKNWRARVVPVPHITEALRGMKRTRKPFPETLLFVGSNGAPFPRPIWLLRLFQASQVELGLPVRDLKALRATAATNLFAVGADAMTVKEALGHKSIVTTMRYSAAIPARLREAMEKVGK